MFARIVTMPLKPGSALKYMKTIEESVIPLLRRHKGFVDEIALVTEDGKTALGISFWDDKESAEAYQRSGYREVMKVLENVTAGAPDLKICEVTNSTAHKISPAFVA